MRRLVHVTVLCAGLGVLTTPAAAELITDPIGDFFPLLDSAAPRGGDLDVVSAQAFLRGGHLHFTATMDAPIGTTDLAFYVWGVDRGTGAITADFARHGLPDIVFDALLIANNDGTGLVNLIRPGLPPISTPLPPGSVTMAGNTIDVMVSLGLLPSTGFLPSDYEWNLWPRWRGVPFGDTQISDFAPDDRNARLTVPEPAVLALLAVGLAAGRRRVWRQRRA